MAQALLPNPTSAGLLRRLPVFALPLVIALAQLQGTRSAALNQPERTPLDALATVLLVAGLRGAADPRRARRRGGPVPG